MKKDPQIIDNINIEDTPPNSIGYYWLQLITDSLGKPVSVPIIVARGKHIKPVLGLTAAIHGDELNGIPVIQRLFTEIDLQTLQGTIIAVPVANVPAYIRNSRFFNDGVDLNHIMPGIEFGNVSQVYAFKLVEKIIKHFDYLLDLHTASHGRVNSFYVRADLSNPHIKELAILQNSQIIVNNAPNKGTLRQAASNLGICAITLEVGNPNTFQKKMIKSGLEGIHNVLSLLKMTNDTIAIPEIKPILCSNSYWLYTNIGGLLTVHVDIIQQLKKGDLVATIRDVFGNILQQYYCPENGIVIGKSTSPVNQTGGRIIHLGIVLQNEGSPL